MVVVVWWLWLRFVVVLVVVGVDLWYATLATIHATLATGRSSWWGWVSAVVELLWS